MKCQVFSRDLNSLDFICVPFEVAMCPISDICFGNSTQGECPGLDLASISGTQLIYSRTNVSQSENLGYLNKLEIREGNDCLNRTSFDPQSAITWKNLHRNYNCISNPASYEVLNFGKIAQDNLFDMKSNITALYNESGKTVTFKPFMTQNLQMWGPLCFTYIGDFM